MAHDYKGIDPEILFDVVTNELPILKTALLRIIKSLPSDAIKEVIQTKQYQHLIDIIITAD